MQVHHILKMKGDASVATIAPGASLAEAAELLSVRRIGSLVVSPDVARVSGILSERDIVRELGCKGAACMAERVDEVMTWDITTCTPADDARDVMQWMTDGRFRHLPVMQDDRLVGLISIGDVVKARLTELSMEKDALEGMIMGY